MGDDLLLVMCGGGTVLRDSFNDSTPTGGFLPVAIDCPAFNPHTPGEWKLLYARVANGLQIARSHVPGTNTGTQLGNVFQSS